MPCVLALAAAGFIYIGAADLIPALYRQAALTAGVSQIVLIVAGIGTLAVLEWIHP